MNKYKFIKAILIEEIDRKVNEWANEGYHLLQVITTNTEFIAIMKLNEAYISVQDLGYIAVKEPETENNTTNWPVHDTLSSPTSVPNTNQDVS